MTRVVMEILESQEWKTFFVYFMSSGTGPVEPSQGLKDSFALYPTRRITHQDLETQQKSVITFDGQKTQHETGPFTIKDHIKGDVHFSFYRDGLLWYRTEVGFLFPVQISDIGNATFHNTDKAMLFMRYIRKHLATLSAGRDANG